MNRLRILLIRGMASTLVLLCTLIATDAIAWAANPVPSAASTTAQQEHTVQTLEDTLFATRYDQEPLANRVTRLEETVFGQAQTNIALPTRISKLQSALSNSTLGALSTAAKPTASSSSTGIKPLSQPGKGSPSPSNASPPNNGASYPAIQAVQNSANTNLKPTPGETDYPTVSQMEQKLFNKTYVQEDITQRLARLEKQVFNTPQSGELADRVDNLRTVVLGDTTNVAAASGALPGDAGYGNPYGPPTAGPNPGYAGGSYYGSPPASSSYYTPSPYGTPAMGGNAYGSQTMPYYDPAGSTAYNTGYGYPSAVPSGNGNYNPMGGGNSASGGNSAVTPDMLSAMNEVEKQVLGQTHPSEPLSSRLDRVETRVFHTTSPDLSPDERIQRVIAVASAGGAPPTAKERAKNTIQTMLPIILTILPLVLL